MERYIKFVKDIEYEFSIIIIIVGYREGCLNDDGIIKFMEIFEKINNFIIGIRVMDINLVRILKKE